MYTNRLSFLVSAIVLALYSGITNAGFTLIEPEPVSNLDTAKALPAPAASNPNLVKSGGSEAAPYIQASLSQEPSTSAWMLVDGIRHIGTPEVDIPLVRKGGQGVSLAKGLRDILPPDWHIGKSVSVSPSTVISWRDGWDWVSTLEDVSKDCSLEFEVDWNRRLVTVSVSSINPSVITADYKPNPAFVVDRQGWATQVNNPTIFPVHAPSIFLPVNYINQASSGDFFNTSTRNHNNQEFNAASPDDQRLVKVDDLGKLNNDYDGSASARVKQPESPKPVESGDKKLVKADDLDESSDEDDFDGDTSQEVNNHKYKSNPPPASNTKLAAEKSGESALVEPITAPAKPSLPEWRAEAGQTLRQTLAAWSKEAGWNLVWSPTLEDVDYLIEGGHAWHANFIDAAKELLRNYRNVEIPLKAELLAGNKQFRVLAESDTFSQASND